MSAGDHHGTHCLAQWSTDCTSDGHWRSQWTNYQVSVDVLLEQAGYVELIGNLTAQVRLAGAEEGYHLKVTNTGAWTLYREDAPTASTRTDTTLASGTVTIGLNSWHTLSLIMNSGNIQALIDGKTVANVNDATYTGGQVRFAGQQMDQCPVR